MSRLLPGFVAAVVLAAATGCGDLGEPLRLGPECDLSAVAVSFGQVAINDSSLRTVTIRNLGSAPLSGDVTLACPAFTVVSGGGSFTLAPDGSRTLTVRFLPSAAGIYACTLDLGTGCTSIALSGVAQDGAPPPPPAVSFANDIQPIFSVRACISCHSGPAASGGMDLSPGSAYGNLVNAVSFGYAPALRVKPLEPINSVLYGKLSNSGQFGGEMPPGSSIPAAEREKVRQWILAGAPNN